MAKYLDEEGLRHLWSNIESKFVDNDELSAAINGLPADAEYTMDYKDGFINLYKDGAKVGEGINAAPFIKDGMLDDVELITVSDTDPIDGFNTGDLLFKFVWNVDGESKIDYVNVNELGVQPETGNTEISKEIKVAGGPLASLCADALGGKITTDMTMQELLEVLFFSENWSTVSKVNGASSVGLNALSVGMTLSATGVQKVGTTVTVNAPTVSQTNKAASAYITGFDYGKYSLDGTTTETCTTSTKVNETSWVYSEEAPSVSITGYAGFGLEANPAAGDTLTVAIGTNSVTATGVGVARTATCAQVGPIYDVSSEGNIADKDANIYTIATQEKSLTAPANQTATATITGVYPVYSNANAAGNTENTGVEYVSDSSTFEVSFGPETSYMNTFVYPASHTISVENFNPQSQQYGSYVGGSNTIDVKVTINGTEYDYKKWTRAGAANTEGTKYKFILNKKTSVL